jgi:hypothetical protein
MAPASWLCLDEIPDLLLQALQPLVELDDRPGDARQIAMKLLKVWRQVVGSHLE